MAKTCFFISRIGDLGSAEREFSDKLLKYIIEPVVDFCGYGRPLRADHITQPGVITTQVFSHLWNDDLVIADLTGGNPNVFYELAVRHIRRKPFVHMIQAGMKIPFDIAPNRTIEFDFDVAKVELSKKALEAMVKSAVDDPANMQTPLSAAVDLSTVEVSSNPLRDGIFQILSIVQEIKGAVARLPEGSVGRRGLGYCIRKTIEGYELQLGNGPIRRISTEETLTELLGQLVGAAKVRQVLDQINSGVPWVFELVVPPLS